MEKQQTKRPSDGASGALAQNQNYRNSIIPQDGFMVGKMDPDRVYRFVSRTYLEKSGGFDRRGWEPITAANSKGECLISPWGDSHTSQGTDVKNGDLVLAFMPKQRVDQKRAAMAYRKGLADGALNRLKSRKHNGVESMDVTIQRPGKSTEQLGFNE